MKEALKLALEALEYASTGNRRPEIIDPAITAIKAALAQPAQEPVATLWQNGETGRTRITMPGDITDCDARWFKAADLYTTPQPAQERNFCSRCGKRTADLTVIHTCTPPQENT